MKVVERIRKKLKRKRPSVFHRELLAFGNETRICIVRPDPDTSSSDAEFLYFTQKAYEVCFLAWDQAVQHRHRIIGPVHLLAALLRQPDTYAELMFYFFDLSPLKLREEVDALLELMFEPRPVPKRKHLPDIPMVNPHSYRLGFRGELVYELASAITQVMNHDLLSTGHLLLGLLAEGLSPANVLLQRWGIDRAKAQEAFLIARKYLDEPQDCSSP